MKSFLRILLTKALPAVVVLLLGIFVASRLVASRPVPEVAPKTMQGTLVEVMEAHPVRERVVVEAMGTVIPAREVDVLPEVGGRIIELNPNLVFGGFVSAGDVIARIDPRDYETFVKQAEAQLETARLNLELEQGRQVVAQREWDVIYPTTQDSQASSDLALRKPHLASAKANVESAKGALEQARLNLERTVIKAPFNAIVRDEAVEVGKLVMQQTRIATLIGSDQYWVQVSVPVSQLQRISIPDKQGKGGSLATVKHEADSNTVIKREGRVIRLFSGLDPAGRMARLLVAVDDPLGFDSDHNDSGLPLLIDAYVRVEIDAGELDDVFVIPRTAVREGDRIWVMDEKERLSVRDVDIVWRRKDDVLVTNHIRPGERVVTSRIPTPIPGMQLRLEDEASVQAAPAPPDASAS